MSDNMINRVLNGRYRITERVGVGGMAEVYRAQDNVLGRTVAVKVMLPNYSEDADFTQRFRQEAASAANLQSPYIVNIYDWGQDKGTYFIVMEYVRGSDLKTGIKERGALNQRKVAEIGAQVCQALSVAHNMDIIHRDIKSQNIMVQPDGNVKVMDFGIARAKNSVAAQTSSVLGTAHYISPEQAQGKELSGSSDIYSLGVVLYEAATGQLPFDGPDAVSVALKQVNEKPVPPRQINPRIDPRLEAIIMKAMAKDPAARFATAGDMRQALNDLLNAGRRTAGAAAASTVVMGAVAANGTAPDGTSVMPAVNGQRQGGPVPQNYQNRFDMEEEAPKKSKKVPIIIAIVAVLVIAGVAAFFLLGGKNGVPDVVGKSLAEAKTAITSAGFTVGDVTEEYSAKVEKGQVAKQTPEAGKNAEKGSKVNLVVSKGAEKCTVPNLLGMTENEAQKALTEAGLVGKAGTPDYSTDYEKGEVMKQDPAAKADAEKGSTVTYIVSLGTETVSLPDVTGKSESEAISTLRSAGFNYGVSYESSSSVSKGYVISQNPAGGGSVKADKGTYVEIVVSSGETGMTIPGDIVGKTMSEAYKSLTSMGFSNVVKNGSDGDIVKSMSPSAGSTVSSDTQISLYN